MLQNYLVTALRALNRNRVFAAINILGLAIGMAACILLLLFVSYETSYDQWLPDHARAYQVQSKSKGSPDSQLSAFIVGRTLAKDFPQIERQAYVAQGEPVIIQNGEAATELVLTADPALLEILRFPMLRGNRATALDTVDSLVLTAEAAARRFPGIDPIGQTLTIVSRGKQKAYRVTAIMADLPANSHFKAGLIVPFNRAAYSDNPQELLRYGWNSGYNYIQLRPGVSPDDITRGLPAWESRNMPKQPFAGAMLSEGDSIDWQIVPVAEVHLGSASQGSQTPGNDPATITTFAIVAFLILAMACINFTNLATARAAHRAREVALRKVLGASRLQLVSQFLGESLTVALISLLIAFAIVELSLPGLSDFLGADLQMHYLGAGGALLPAMALWLVVGIAAGLYPALVLSRFDPAPVLKANSSGTATGGGPRIRSALVLGQFAVSIALIICTSVIAAQTRYARTSNPGFDRTGLLQIDGIARRQLSPVVEQIITAIARTPGVESVGRSMIGVNTDGRINSLVRRDGNPAPIEIGGYGMDDGFFKTMGLRLLAGRDLDANRPGDDAQIPENDPAAEQAQVARGINVVVNAAGAQRLGFKNPDVAIGNVVRIAMVNPEFGLVPATIVGVVSDAQFRSAREAAEPVIFRLDKGFVAATVVRVKASEAGAVRDRIAQVWKRYAPQVPFKAKFTDDIVREQYDADEARAMTFAGFAGLAIIVACLGLYGLAAFTAERRTREIGIRKVLGARDRDIVTLLVWQFSQPVLIANLIAWPVAWWLMRDWLDGFDARIDLGPLWFIGAGVLAAGIAAATIIGHALKVARSSPAAALRYE